MERTVYEIDGTRFATLDELFDEVSRVIVPGKEWGRNLDAFDDLLSGGFGTPDEGFTIKWKNHAISRERLGYEETARRIADLLQRCDPSNADALRAMRREALARRGATLFDTVVDIVRQHADADSGGVRLILD